MIDTIILNEQYSFADVPDSFGHVFVHLLLCDGHLLCRILVPIRTHLTFLLRIENDRELAWLQWLEDESKFTVSNEVVIIVLWCLFHKLPLLC